jgi:hypothetical protein
MKKRIVSFLLVVIMILQMFSSFPIIAEDVATAEY